MRARLDNVGTVFLSKRYRISFISLIVYRLWTLECTRACTLLTTMAGQGNDFSDAHAVPFALVFGLDGADDEWRACPAAFSSSEAELAQRDDETRKRFGLPPAHCAAASTPMDLPELASAIQTATETARANLNAVVPLDEEPVICGVPGFGIFFVADGNSPKPKAAKRRCLPRVEGPSASAAGIGVQQERASVTTRSVDGAVIGASQMRYDGAQAPEGSSLMSGAPRAQAGAATVRFEVEDVPVENDDDALGTFAEQGS